MTQLPMFHPTNIGERPALPVLPLARTTDPETSKSAARALVGSKALGQMQLTALCLVRAYPGLTANALARKGGYGDPRKINRRLSELERVDLIYIDGSEEDPETGRQGQRWWPL